MCHDLQMERFIRGDSAIYLLKDYFHDIFIANKHKLRRFFTVLNISRAREEKKSIWKKVDLRIILLGTDRRFIARKSAQALVYQQLLTRRQGRRCRAPLGNAGAWILATSCPSTVATPAQSPQAKHL